MLSFTESLSIFWQESEAHIAVYAAYALLACLVISAFEFRNQTSSIPYRKFLIKAIALTVSTTAIFILWMYAAGWQSRLLGGEIITSLSIAAVWYAALYFLNRSLLNAFALSLQKAGFHTHLPGVVLILPCLLFYAFIVALGAAWTI